MRLRVRDSELFVEQALFSLQEVGSEGNTARLLPPPTTHHHHAAQRRHISQAAAAAPSATALPPGGSSSAQPQLASQLGPRPILDDADDNGGCCMLRARC